MLRLAIIWCLLLSAISAQAYFPHGSPGGGFSGTIVQNFSTGTYTGAGCTSSTACISVTRASTSYAQTTSGSLTSFGPNVARITNNGLLKETSSENLLLQSNTTTNASWSNAGVAASANGALTAPDGTATVTQIVEDTSSGFHFSQQSFTQAATTTTYTYSAYAQIIPGSASRSIELQCTDGTNAATGTFGLTGNGAVLAENAFGNFNIGALTISQSAYGFYRVSMVLITNTGTTQYCRPFLAQGTNPYSPNYTGDGVSGVALWCQQLEPNVQVPSSCIPTTTVSVTRPADQITATGNLKTALCGAHGYAVAVVGQLPVTSAYELGRNGTVDAFLALPTTAAVEAQVGSTAVASTPFGSAPTASTGTFNIGVSWGDTGIDYLTTVANGGAVGGTASTFGATCNPYIGSADGANDFDNGYTKSLTVGTSALSNAALQAAAPAAGALFCPNYYVDPVNGNDSNTGCATGVGHAWASVAAVNAGSFIEGATINMTGSITGCPVFSSTTNILSSSASDPITLAEYGAGYTLTSNCGSSTIQTVAITIDGVNGFTVNGGTVRGSGYTTGTNWGILFTNTNPTDLPIGTLIIENTDIGGFAWTGSGNGKYPAAIFVAGYFSQCVNINNYSILDNVMHGTAGTTSPDGAAVGGYSCGLNKGTATSQGNTGYDIGGPPSTASGVFEYVGTFGNGTPGTGLSEKFDLVRDSGANNTACGGSAGLENDVEDSPLQQFFEVYNVTLTSGCDGEALDIDQSTTNGLAQYFYGHENYGPGVNFFIAYNGGVSNWGPNTIRFGILENNNAITNDHTSGNVGFNVQLAGVTESVFNMTLWNSLPNSSGNPAPSCVGALETGAGAIASMHLLFANNICAQTVDEDGDAAFVYLEEAGTNSVFETNDYYSINGGTPYYHNGTTYTSLSAWQAACSCDAGSVTTSPGFANGGMGGNLTWTPSTITSWPPSGGPTAYNQSALTTSGTGVSGIGTRDYYANTLSSPYPIGANQ